MIRFLQVLELTEKKNKSLEDWLKSAEVHVNVSDKQRRSTASILGFQDRLEGPTG